MKSPAPDRSGFSLIEVTLSLGIIAFALVSVLGLLPAGLNSQKQASDQARGVQILNDVTQAVRGIHEKNGALEFAPPLKGLSGLKVFPGSQNSFALLEDGTLTAETDTSLGRRGTVYVEQKAQSANAPRGVFVSVAWPHTARRVNGSWSQATNFNSVYVCAPF